MFCPFLAWNPINLVDGESHWFIQEIIFILIALIISKFLHPLLLSIAKRAGKPAFVLFADSVYTPLISLIWYLLALYTFNLVTDDLLSETRPKLWNGLLNGGTVIALGWFLLRLKDRFIDRAIHTKTAEGKRPEVSSMQAISKLFTVVIWLIVLMLLNDFTGRSFTTLLALGGVGGLALAFASQEIVSNFFGGFMIHMTRPFVIGEWVSVPSINIEGAVEEIGWYQTRIRPKSKDAVYAPNSLFSKALLINKTRITHRLFEQVFYLNVDPLSSIEKIVQETKAYLASHPSFDNTQSMGSRIETIGPTSTITAYGLTQTISEEEYNHLRDEVLLHIAHIIASHEGKLALPPLTLQRL